jgi:hypothetical protein
VIFRAISATTGNQVASPMKPRNFLGIYNQSTTATVYVAFDVAAVAAATAGQLTIGPAVTGGVPDRVVFDGESGTDVPTGAVNIIASAAAPVTLVE